MNHFVLPEKLKDLSQPFCMVLVGLPGSGKSTFLNCLKNFYNINVASTDDYIEREGAKLGMNYSEAFGKINFKYAKQYMDEVISSSIKNSQNFAIDQTNVGSKARRSKISMVPENYLKICAVFDVPDEVLFERLEKRAKETGKMIPRHVITDMTSRWETPSKEEGFHLIYNHKF